MAVRTGPARDGPELAYWAHPDSGGVVMTQPAVHAGRIGNEAATRVRQASPWITALGRLGFACKGVVYLLIGTLAVQAALGRGGATTDAKGVLAQVLNAP